MENKDSKRYCEPFNTTPQEYEDYKASKYTRLIWYVIAMVLSSLFNDRWAGYIVFTLLLIISYIDDYQKEKQWKKDGSMTDDNMK